MPTNPESHVPPRPAAHLQYDRTMQRTRTSIAPDAALAEAKRFFARRNSVYVAYLEREGPGYATFRGQGGEEIAIAACTVDGTTEVTGSSYLFDQQVARFLSSLPAAATIAASGTPTTTGAA